MGVGSATFVVAELAGLPGAGKSAIAARLAGRDGVVTVQTYRNGVGIAAYMRGVKSSLRPALRERPAWVGPREIRRLVRLGAAHELIRTAREGGAKAVVFDQGPMFTLARLVQAAGDPTLEPPDAWWTRALAAWATSLDVVIWLDAPTEVLLARIGDRPKDHIFEGLPHDDVARAMREELARFERIQSRCSRGATPPEVIRLDTAETGIEATADVVLRAIGAEEADRIYPENGRPRVIS